MKGALIFALGTIAVAAAVIAGFALWSNNDPEGALRSDELAWIGRYYEWGHSGRGCAAIPPAESRSLRRIERLAHTACEGEIPWSRVNGAIQARLFLSRPLPRTTGETDESHIDPRLGRIVTKLASRPVQARCWSGDDWTRVNVELATIYPRYDFWIIGWAEPRGRVHFRGDICRTLARFYGRGYTPSRNIERAELATAFVVLAHEAEHEHDFSSSEAEVECFAVQHVRDLVRENARKKAFADEIAGYAWDVSYLRNDPVYSTGRCRNGGPLDLHPESDAWP
jgi:hypothetical protein